MELAEALSTSGEPRQGEFQRFLRFTAVGVLAAAANVGSRILFSRAMGYSFAVAAAYLIGMVIAFSLSRLFVFDSTANPWQKEMIRFAMVNAVGFLQVWLVSLALVDWLLPKIGFTWHAEAVAHMVGVASPIISSYFGHKHFSFRG